MAAKHTPGLWLVIPDCGKLGVATREGENTEGQPMHWLVASVNGKRDEWEANANLIAAAPELLEACVAYIADREEAGCTMDSASVKRMRAAIAKATGSAA